MKIKLYENGNVTYSNGKGNDIESLRAASKLCREYNINNSDYRNIVSAACKLGRTSEAVSFWTFTFANNPDEKQANGAIKKFFKELKREYNRDLRYVWTKERQKNGKFHFHSIVDVGYMDVQSLQGLWNRAVVFSCGSVGVSNNSFRLPPKSHRSIFDNKNVDQIARYIGKYVSKERYNAYSQPVFAISKSLYPLSYELNISDERELYDTFERLGYQKKEYFAISFMKLTDELRQYIGGISIKDG